MENFFNNQQKDQSAEGSFLDIISPENAGIDFKTSPFANAPKNLVFQKPELNIPTPIDLFDRFLEAFFPKLYKIRAMKKALKKLDKLNETVAQLTSKNIPYGEEEERSEMLSNYLNRANTIHTNIRKEI